MAAERAGSVGTIPLGETGPLKIRAFFGLPIPEAQRGLLEGFIADCSALAPQFRWTPAANLHLTIRFLGGVEASIAEGIADRLAHDRLNGFDLELGQVGSFKRRRLASVVWLGVPSGINDLAKLAATVEGECVRAGLEPEGRRFNAHLTIARSRARDGAPLPDLPALPTLTSWRADELILYRSHLGRAGSVYEPLRRIRLS